MLCGDPSDVFKQVSVEVDIDRLPRFVDITDDVLFYKNNIIYNIRETGGIVNAYRNVRAV